MTFLLAKNKEVVDIKKFIGIVSENCNSLLINEVLKRHGIKMYWEQGISPRIHNIYLSFMSGRCVPDFYWTVYRAGLEVTATRKITAVTGYRTK